MVPRPRSSRPPKVSRTLIQRLLLQYDSTVGSNQLKVYKQVGTAWTLVGNKTSTTAFATGVAETLYLRCGAIVGNQYSVLDFAYRFSSTSLHTLDQWNEYAANTHTLAQLHGELAFTAYYIFSDLDYASDYMHDRTDAQLDFPAIGSPSAGTAAHIHHDSVPYDSTNPTVTINQPGTQGDPTSASPINFTAVFSKLVTGFATGDVTLTGAAGATTGTVTEIAPNDGTTYNVAVSGMTGSGTVIAAIAAEKANDAAGNPNVASTSTDHTVIYDVTAPTLTLIANPGITEATEGVYHFTTRIADPSLVAYASVDATAIYVTGPNSYQYSASLDDVPVSNFLTADIACTVPPPNTLDWRAADNGTYHIWVQGNHLHDVPGNYYEAPTEIGTFTVSVAAAAPARESRTAATLAALRAAGVLEP